MLLWLCKLYFLICSEKILFVLLIEHNEWQNIKSCCDGNWYLSMSNYYLDSLRFLHDLYEIKKKTLIYAEWKLIMCSLEKYVFVLKIAII